MPIQGRAAVISTMVVVSALAMTGASPAMAAKKPLTLLVPVTMKADTDAWTRVCTEFTKENKGIPVKLMAVPWENDLLYFQQYITMATAGVAPDVLLLLPNWVPNFADSNVIEDLTPWAKRTGVKLSEWTDAGIASAAWRGRQWGIPGGPSSDFWVQFNRQVIAESGVVDPGTLFEQRNWNWDTMEMIMSKTSRFNGNKCVRIGLDQMGDLWSIAPWVWGMGGQVLNEDGTACMLGEPAAIEAISKIHNLIFGKKIMGLAWHNYGLDHIASAQKSQFAMTAWWSTLGMFFISQKVSWPVDMVPFPAGPKSARTNVAEVLSLAMSRQSKQKEAAWKFLQFAGGTRGQIILLEDLQALPTRKDLTKRLGETYRKANMLSAAASVDDAFARQRIEDRSPKMHLAMPKILAAYDKIWSGKAEVATTLKDAARAATAELARVTKRK